MTDRQRAERRRDGLDRDGQMDWTNGWFTRWTKDTDGRKRREEWMN